MYLYLTIAHKCGTVLGPGAIYSYSIWCTVCPHPPSWNIPLGTHEEYLCTKQGTLIHSMKPFQGPVGIPQLTGGKWR